MPNWPATVPFFNNNRTSRKVTAAGQLRTPMSYGPAKVRCRTSADPRSAPVVSNALTSAQYATFEAFWNSDLNAGVLPFTATDLFDNVSKTWRFVGGYTTSKSGDRYIVTAELEILP